jgi:hypothetical protein
VVSPRTREGDQWSISVTFAGERVSRSGRIPADVSVQNVVLLLAEGLSAVTRELRATAEQQARTAEAMADE